MKTHRLFLITSFALLAFSACSKAPDNSAPIQSTNQVMQDQSGKTVLYWYDSMVPDKHFDKPGKSPFMDMQLMPKYKEEGNKQ
ncbi:MAG: hypothetical protein H7Z18_12325 [Methylophilaceae bacterium]|nr:hypothetical protein [Methylophilaceae bacterium]